MPAVRHRRRPGPKPTPARARHVAEALEVRCLLSAPEPNNSFAAAYVDPNNIYADQNVFDTDSVSKASDTDDYREFFNLYGASHLYAALEGLSADADLYVYGQNQNLLAVSELGGDSSETINVDLPASQYFYVRVAAYSGATNYDLYLYNDYAGSTMATARDIGVSWGQSDSDFYAFAQLSQQDYLDYRDNVDYFKFQMEAPGTVSLRLASNYGGGLQGDVQLQDASGDVLSDQSRAFEGGGFNFFNVTANTGTYYVKVTQTSGSDPYSLRIVSDYAGDRTATARDLGDVTGQTREDHDMVGGPFDGLASYTDLTDLYKFTLAQSSPLYLGLTIDQGLTAPTFDANLQLARDSNGDGFIESNEVIASSSKAGDDAISTTLAAGNYYAVVNQNGAYTSYTLDLDSNIDSGNGNAKSLATATNWGSLVGQTASGFDYGGSTATPADTTDYYKFTMTAAGTFSASVFIDSIYARSSDPLTLRLIRDANGNGLVDTGDAIDSVTGTTTTTNLSKPLSAGTYYLEVQNDGTQQSWYLRGVADYAGNTLATARAFATVSGNAPATQTFQDYIEEDFGASSDVDDFYKFTLPAAYAVSLKTTGIAGDDLSLELIHDANGNGKVDSGDVLATADQTDTATESITKTLAAGTYYVDVHGVNGGTNYTLAASFASGTTPTATKLTGTTIGTSGSFKNDGNTIAKATDGNLSTYYDGAAPNGNYVGLDLGKAATITSLAYASRSGYASRMNGGVFQASNSATFASGVVTLYTVAAGANPPDSLTTRAVTATGTYRYVRYLSPNGSYGDVAEVQFFGTPGTATPARLSGTTYGTSGSFGNDGDTVAKATDGSLSTYFDGPTASGATVDIDLGSANVVSQIKFAPRGSYASRMVGGVFQASNSSTFASGVVTVYTIGSAPASGSLTTVAPSTTTAYRYWRYVGPTNGYCNIAEFELFG